MPLKTFLKLPELSRKISKRFANQKPSEIRKPETDSNASEIPEVPETRSENVPMFGPPPYALDRRFKQLSYRAGNDSTE